MNEDIKKLTGKNPQAFEAAAFETINKPDTELFSQLVGQEDFLFDFVKQNVAARLEKACTKSNYLNLLHFLKYYSPSYEDFIISTLVKFGDEKLESRMFDIFRNGTTDEKIYCAKYFELTKNNQAAELLRKYSYDENSYLASNCAAALSALGDTTSFNNALKMLNSEDDFTKLDSVRFLVSYGNKAAVNEIINVMKTSPMADNIAGELLYLCDMFEIYSNDKCDGLFVFNLIINGLGEIFGLRQVFDFRLYDFISMLLKEPLTSDIAVILLAAEDKFATLTENDEYLYDETKDTKQEIFEIKKLLATADSAKLYPLADKELKPDSLFAFTALEFTENEEAVRALLKAANPALVLKALETLKMLGSITPQDKSTALGAVADENVRLVIVAI